MKLANRYIDTMLDIGAEIVNTIIIESPSYYAENVKQFYMLMRKEECSWVFSCDHVPIVLGDNIEIVIDFINLEFSSKKIMSGLSKYIAREIAQENFKFQEYFQSGYNLLSNLLLPLLPDVELADSLDHNAFIKMFSPRVAADSESLIESLVRYVNALIEFTSIKVLICIGLKSYLSRDDFEQFAKHTAMQQLPLICIEQSESYRIADEKILIIDCDLCEIVL